MSRNSVLFLIVFILNVFCLHAYEYEGRLIRTTRQRERTNSKPRIPVELEGELEDSYGDIITSRPKYYQGGNQWKPMYEYDEPPHRPSPPITKYRSKPTSYSPKYQQETVYPPDFYPKRPPPSQEYSSTNFIANQTLYVTDSVRPSKSSSQKKTKHRETYSKKHSPPPQYQVHEDIDDDEPYYEGSHSHPQNQYHHQQDIIVGKPKGSTQYSPYLPIVKEKHIHHVHYPNGEEEILSEQPSGNIYRYPSHPSSVERRPEGRPYTRNSRYSSSYASKRPY